MPEKSSDGIAVMQSFPQPRPTTNPYLIMLAASLEATPGVEVTTFDWKRALRADYDVFHIHWPENLARSDSRAKGLGRRIATRLLLLRLRAKRIPIVRTLHNLERPAGLSRGEYRILDRIDRQTAMIIRLSDRTPLPAEVDGVTIPHGHYREWFASYDRAERIPFRIGFFGLIRRYKNVEHLVLVHSQLPTEYTLRVAGSPSTQQLADEIVSAARGDDRVTFDLRFQSDAELVAVVSESELVVLPYTEMHNSGSVLSSLSLERPVLVRDNAINRALEAEVGPGWIYFYSDELEAADIRSAIDGIRERTSIDPPDLRGRDWDQTGAAHARAYRQAIRSVSRAR